MSWTGILCGTEESLKMPDTISVFGLGKLGLPFAVTWAARGFRVIGLDVRPEVLRALASGKLLGAEPPIESLLKKAGSRFSVTLNLEDAVQRSDVSFVVVPTPSDARGGFSTRYVEEVLGQIGTAIRKKRGFHLITIVSTVLPGASDSVLKPLLEHASGKLCGKDFGLCYNPEFIALGEVVRGLLTPDLVLIGESDPVSGRLLARMHERFCKNEPPIVRMSLWNAELAKISINVYVTMKISFANTLAALCERIPGGNVDVVSRAVGLDSRVGSKYLKGGLGYGGPCFPRDNRAFSRTAEQFGTQARLSQATDEVNAEQSVQLATRILRNLHEIEKPRVAILGLTYKPNTFVVEESAAVSIAQFLAEHGVVVKGYDPAGMGQVKSLLGDKIQLSADISECLSGSDFCVLATPWGEFRGLEPSIFLEKMRHPTILDCWRILDRSRFQAHQNIRYLAVGVNESTPNGKNSAVETLRQ